MPQTLGVGASMALWRKSSSLIAERTIVILTYFCLCAIKKARILLLALSICQEGLPTLDVMVVSLCL